MSTRSHEKSFNTTSYRLSTSTLTTSLQKKLRMSKRDLLMRELHACYETQTRTAEMLLLTTRERGEWETLERALQIELAALQRNASTITEELRDIGAGEFTEKMRSS